MILQAAVKGEAIIELGHRQALFKVQRAREFRAAWLATPEEATLHPMRLSPDTLAADGLPGPSTASH